MLSSSNSHTGISSDLSNASLTPQNFPCCLILQPPRSLVSSTGLSLPLSLARMDTFRSHFEIISSEAASDTSNPISETTTGRRSWVWAHFDNQTVEGVRKHICQVFCPYADKKIRGFPMQPNKTKSTKSRIQHLSNQHDII